ncbi:hypothetical protein ONZ43_g3908 [Nemania bipapillata]|uniref:Uncharacterized protein n=1 Tax=Nemania bipapillata TaxID=110536 RepID=A0ACC2IUX6_9PEZI|nr:hypothetical protein ONZ43_g3908 [Nemania bipapillata]
MTTNGHPTSAEPDGKARDETTSERTPLLPSSSSNGSSAADSEQQQQQSDTNGTDERTIIVKEVTGLKLWTIMGTCWIGVFLGAIDSSVISTLSAPISSEFQSLSLLPWLATAYLISNAACQPISGRLTDIFGRGPGLVFSNIFFAAGNLICGLAPSANVMILGRIVAGITFLGTDLVPLRNRGVVQGVGNICYGTGAMLGGVFGGFVNDNSSWGWRLAFLVQVPPVLVSAVLVGYLVRIPPKVSGRSYLARIDFTAAIDHSHQATITSATYAFRSVGSTVGITVGSAIYQNVLKSNLWERFGDLPGAAEEIKRIRDDLDELNHLPDGWYDGVAASFQEAFRSVWFTLLGLAILAIISVSLMKQHKLHSTLARNEGD